VRDNVPGIALGNVVGSNTANILLVLGIPAILSSLQTSECDTRKTYVFMLISSVLFVGLAFFGIFTIWSGLILLAGLGVLLFDQVYEARAHRMACSMDDGEAEMLDEADPNMPYWRVGMFLLLGLVGLPLGANLLVENATVIALTYGVSETVIGLTLVAVGTSLPELATTVMAALRKQADVALGNVIGSNMFNLLAIIGVATFFGPIPVDPQFLRFDLWVMLAASLLLAPFVFFKLDITRLWGIVLTLLYFAYATAVLL